MNDCIIVGSGPAGLTAAIYLSRGGFQPLVLTGVQPGGQLTLTTEIENYPGFESIPGGELMLRMKQQAEKFGTKVETDQVTKIEKIDSGFKVIGGKGEYLSKSVIVATGASAVWLDTPGVDKLRGKGISACATCDGPFFREKAVAVIGGGDTAFIEAEFLSRFAKKVYIIHRREEYRAEQIMQDRVFKSEKVAPLFNSQVKEFQGDEKLTSLKLETKFKVESDKFVDKIKIYPQENGGKVLEENSEGIVWQLPIDGAFMAIGHKPNTDFLKGFIELDESGYVKVEDQVLTSAEGVFAAGDMIANKYKQATVAVGSGCMAAIEAQEYLENLKMRE